MKYKIWNKVDPLVTPVGEVFEAQDYIAQRAPFAALPQAKIVISGEPGMINCSVFMEFYAMKAHYEALGATLDDGMSDQEVLDAISAWEAAQAELAQNPPPSSEERLAAAMEFQNMMLD